MGSSIKISLLFISRLKHLKAIYWREKTSMLIVGNSIIHKCKETLRWLNSPPKFRIIYQLVYST
ncbi:hypothetical protein A6A26_24020 (plasmid) [Pantoea sp. OXWO6B1]|nr:hypothetical protein A6A26_24020 [Pantoea sp. OXWO6B1]